MATLDEAAAYLAGLINVERLPDFRRARLSLEPIRRLLDRLEISLAGLSALHIAGSKGKGSTALLAEELLRAHGLRVGTFTSPHLESWTERFRIDGKEVTGEKLAEVVERLRPEVDALRDEWPEDAPSFFDATTAAALALFADAGVDHVVLEVGLGGRLDSTNIVTPAVACVTSIELEHTEKLGTSLTAIAREKAGIAKPGVPLVMGALPAEAAAVVEERAGQLGCALARYGSDFSAEILEEDLDDQRIRFREGSLPAPTRRETPPWLSPACGVSGRCPTGRSVRPPGAPSPPPRFPRGSSSSPTAPGWSSTRPTRPPRRRRWRAPSPASRGVVGTSCSPSPPERIWRRSAAVWFPSPISSPSRGQSRFVRSHPGR
jgi:hypothetical protein